MFDALSRDRQRLTAEEQQQLEELENLKREREQALARENENRLMLERMRREKAMVAGCYGASG